MKRTVEMDAKISHAALKGIALGVGPDGEGAGTDFDSLATAPRMKRSPTATPQALETPS